MLGVDVAAWDTFLTADHSGGSGVTPDPTTVQMIRAAGLSVLRISNGSGADAWHFSSSHNQFPDGVGLLANLAAAAGTDALVTVNYGTGTPQEAAAYLAYLNGSVTNRFRIGVDKHGKNWGTVADWARLRAQSPVNNGDGLDSLRAGHPQPFGFTHFEVGNEVYYHAWSGAPSSIDPRKYVTFAKTFAQEARHVDPSALIGLDIANPGEYDAAWNVPMLRACRSMRFTPGFLSDHFYVYDGHQETLSDTDLLEHGATDPTSVNPVHGDSPRNWAARAAAFRTLLNQQLGKAASKVELICAEFNSDADAATKQSTNLVHGLFLADAIGGALQTEYNSVIVWDLRNAYQDVPQNPSFYGWRSGTDSGLIGTDTGAAPATGPYVPYPAYFAEQLASMMIHTGDQVVTAASDRADLSAYAVRQQDGHLDLLVVNKSPIDEIAETFAISGFTPSGPAQVWQYGRAEDTAQSQTADGSASLSNSGLTLAVDTASGVSQFQYTVPPYSMMVIDLAP
jgi:hypothetical protein